MYELGQPSTSFGVANETLDDTIIINENRQENADYHMMTRGLGLADYQSQLPFITRFRVFGSKNCSAKKFSH